MSSVSIATGNGERRRPGIFPDPVFVLCSSRSGSTLLYRLLDAHPDVACPPETYLPSLCAQLATAWSLLEGAPLSGNRGDELPVIPDAAIGGIRQMMDLMVGSYLERRGKKRYCDRSPGTTRYASLLVRVYPEIKFICLYQDPMDVISPALEASPWELPGYAADPGIAAVEREFPERCHRVRYDDLVADPASAAGSMFEFLDLAPAPGISDHCLRAGGETGSEPPGHPRLKVSLDLGLARIDERFTRNWAPCRADTFVLISLPQDPAQPAARYRIDLAALTVTTDDRAAAQEPGWDVIGLAEDWDDVINRRTNFGAALQACQLRYGDAGDTGPRTSQLRLAMLADLLGLTGWEGTRPLESIQG